MPPDKSIEPLPLSTPKISPRVNFNVPGELTVNAALVVELLVFIVTVPLLMVKAVAVEIVPDNTKLPAPDMVMVGVVPVTVPRVSVVFAAGLKLAALEVPEMVVAPNVIPAVVPVAWLPVVMVSVWAPMLNVPSVWVTPATEVSVSD